MLVAYLRIGNEMRTLRKTLNEGDGEGKQKMLAVKDHRVIIGSAKTAALNSRSPVTNLTKKHAIQTTNEATPTTTTTSTTTTTTSTTTTTRTTHKPTTTSRQQFMQSVSLTMRQRGMTQAEKIIVLDLLQKIVKVADQLGITYFLSGGAMVGSWRNHGIIPWDDDIDLSFNVSDKDKLRKGIFALGSPYKVNDERNRIKMWSEHSPIQSPYSWKWPYIDVVFFQNNATHIWDKAEEFSETKYKMTDVFPLHKRPFENMWFNAPHNIVNMYMLYFEKPEWCTTWWYAHKYEKSGKMIGFNCSELAPYFPFVHRDIVNGTMRETLRLNDIVVNSVMVPGEPIEHITAPYGFTLLKSTK
jgi:hypothetical protein